MWKSGWFPLGLGGKKLLWYKYQMATILKYANYEKGVFMKILLYVTLAAFLLAGVAFCGDSTKVEKKADTTEAKKKTDSTEVKKKMEEPEMKTTKLGVKYQDLVVGEGAECKDGSRVECHYTLFFASPDGTKGERFQSSKDFGKPFICTLGQGLITGWSDGMAGMKEGGTRRMIIPPELGYGQGGRGIPPNQTLLFEIDFIRLIK